VDGQGCEVEPSSVAPNVSLLPVFLLFQILLVIGTQVLARCTNSTEQPVDFPTSPVGIVVLIAWSGGTAYAWGRLRFSPKTAIFPFFLATCFWAISFLGRADTSEEIINADFAHRVFYCCLTIMIVSVIRLVLGEGHQQTATLKRVAGFFIPDLKRSVACPQESLLRASSLPETPIDTLLRPAIETTEAAPEQLLRPSQSKGL